MLSEPERFAADEEAGEAPVVDEELGVALKPLLPDDGHAFDLDVAEPEVPLESDLWLLVEPVCLAGNSFTVATRCFLASRRAFISVTARSTTTSMPEPSGAGKLKVGGNPLFLPVLGGDDLPLGGVAYRAALAF